MSIEVRRLLGKCQPPAPLVAEERLWAAAPLPLAAFAVEVAPGVSQMAPQLARGRVTAMMRRRAPPK